MSFEKVKPDRSVGDVLSLQCISCGGEREHRLNPLQLPVADPAYADHLIAQCTTCGLTSAWPQPTEEELKDAYSEEPHIVRRVDGLGRFWRAYRDGARLRLLKRVAPAQATIVDVGTGAGMILSIARTNREWKMIGTDYSERNIDSLKAEGFDARVGMIDDVGLEPNSVDVIWASHVIEHMRDPVGFLQSVEHYLKPQGKLVAILPSSTTLRARTGTSTWHFVNPPGHLWGFSPTTFRRLLEKNRYVVERLFNSIPVCEMICIATPGKPEENR